MTVVEWEYHILEKLYELGGSACLKDIYSAIENDHSFRLSVEQRRRTVYGNRPAFQHQVRSHVSNLVKKNQVTRVKRGCYELTTEGEARFVELK
jgi:hypothetical protein